jgi:hypothetical protein
MATFVKKSLVLRMEKGRAGVGTGFRVSTLNERNRSLCRISTAQKIGRATTVYQPCHTYDTRKDLKLGTHLPRVPSTDLSRFQKSRPSQKPRPLPPSLVIAVNIVPVLPLATPAIPIKQRAPSSHALFE